MTVGEAIPPARPQLGRAVVPLLALAVLINYVDRGNLATAAPLMKGELHLSSTQIGILVSAFFWSYVPSHALVSWLIERINAYRTLALGPAIGTFFGGILMAATGWRPVFLFFGLASLLWLWPWLATTGQASVAATRNRDGPAPSVWTILRRWEAIGATLGQFCGNYAIYFVISWLPLYLVKSRGFSMTEMAELSGLIYLVYAANTVFSGWVCDRLIAAGASVTLVRKGAIVGGYLLIAASLVICAVGDATVSVISLFVAGFMFGVTAPALYCISQTLAGPRVGGKWVSLQNGIANIAGIVAPIITGVVVDRTGEFYWAFVIAGAVSLVGAVAWGTMIRKVEQIDWGVQEPAVGTVA